MMNKNFTDQNAMSIVKMGVVVLVLYVIYKLYQKISDPFGTGAEADRLDDVIDIKKENLTYPSYWYTTSAKTLENALLEDPWESESEVSAIIWQIQNDDDIALLVKEFGVKELWYGFVPALKSYNLVSAIQTYIPEMVEHYNNHFEGWNMKFRF